MEDVKRNWFTDLTVMVGMLFAARNGDIVRVGRRFGDVVVGDVAAGSYRPSA